MVGKTCRFWVCGRGWGGGEVQLAVIFCVSPLATCLLLPATACSSPGYLPATACSSPGYLPATACYYCLLLTWLPAFYCLFLTWLPACYCLPLPWLPACYCLPLTWPPACLVALACLPAFHFPPCPAACYYLPPHLPATACPPICLLLPAPGCPGICSRRWFFQVPNCSCLPAPARPSILLLLPPIHLQICAGGGSSRYLTAPACLLLPAPACPGICSRWFFQVPNCSCLPATACYCLARYVQQEVVLPGTSSVWEYLSLHAQLRLPGGAASPDLVRSR